MPLISYQGTVTFRREHCIDTWLSCLHVQVFTLGRLPLDDFSLVRVDRLKFCCIIPSGVDLQRPGFRIPVVSRIQGSWRLIPDSKAQDSGIQKRQIHGFRNPDSLT